MVCGRRVVFILDEICGMRSEIECEGHVSTVIVLPVGVVTRIWNDLACFDLWLLSSLCG